MTSAGLRLQPTLEPSWHRELQAQQGIYFRQILDAVSW